MPSFARLSGLLTTALALALVGEPVVAQNPPRADVRVAPRAIVMGAQAGGRLGLSLDLQDMPTVAGARVIEVPEGSPAAVAGIRAYDILTHLDGVSLGAALADAEREADLDEDRPLPPQRLIALLSEHESGDTVRVRYRRDGAEGEVSVILGQPDRGIVTIRSDGSRRAPLVFEGGRISLGDGMRVLDIDSLRSLGENARLGLAPRIRLDMDSLGMELKAMRLDPMPSIRLRMDSLPSGGGDLRVFGLAPGDFGRGIVLSMTRIQGIEFRDLDDDLGAYFGGSTGALVLSAEEDNGLGLRGGDVLLSVDGRVVEDTGDAGRILRSYESGDEVTLRIRREGVERELVGRIR